MRKYEAQLKVLEQSLHILHVQTIALGGIIFESYEEASPCRCFLSSIL